MDKLLQLIEKTKGSVTIQINPHRDYYQTIRGYLEEQADGYLDEDDLPDDYQIEMEKRDSLIIIQWYPDTPNGFKTVAHYDLEKAIEKALSTFN